MSVYKIKGSPFYHYAFDVKRRRFTGSTRLRDEDAAIAFEAERKAEARAIVERDEAELRGPLTLQIACNRWWAEYGSTLADQKIKSALDRLVEIIGGKTYLHDITDDVVSRMVQQRRKDTRRDRTVDGKNGKRQILYRPITTSTVNRTTDLLRRVMNRARDNWSASVPRMPTWAKHRLKEKQRHVRELTAADESALDAAEAPDYAELRRFAILTGLRRRDMLITWPQVDFELGIIRVMTKGDTPRIIPMTREIYAMLWRRRGHHPTFVFTYQAERNSVIPKSKGGGVRTKGNRYPITYYGISSHKARRWQKAGVSARIHDLRHTAGMRTLRGTGNLKAVQKLLGHTDIAITAKFYTDANVEDLRAAMEASHKPRELTQSEPKLIEKKE